MRCDICSGGRRTGNSLKFAFKNDQASPFRLTQLTVKILRWLRDSLMREVHCGDFIAALEFPLLLTAGCPTQFAEVNPIAPVRYLTVNPPAHDSKTLLPTDGAFPRNSALVSLRQPENAEFSMLVTPLGIVTLPSRLQPENAGASMLVTPEGIVTLVSALQAMNAALPMLVTHGGSVTLLSSLQAENAPLPMLVTPAGIVTLVSPLE